MAMKGRTVSGTRKILMLFGTRRDGDENARSPHELEPLFLVFRTLA